MQLVHKILILSTVLALTYTTKAQNNSPLSRFALGTTTNTSNIFSRGMGGISAGLADKTFGMVNSNNPASYPYLAFPRNKLFVGLTSLEVGVDYQSQTLRNTNTNAKYTSNDLIFNYVQIGIPLDTPQRFGLALGIKPLTRVGYNIETFSKLRDPQTNLPIDSARDNFEGSGGVNQAFVGLGYRLGGFSAGFNTGGLFGKKNYGTRRTIYNDSVFFQQANYETKVNFSSLFLELGVMYQFKINQKKQQFLTVGANYRHQASLNATKDLNRETFTFNSNDVTYLRLDSVFEDNNVKGTIIMPSTWSIGFNYENGVKFSFGADYTVTNWSKYRFYNQPDGTRNTSQLKIGAQYYPAQNSFWGRNSYRIGYNTGTNLIASNNIKENNFTLGIGLNVYNPNPYYSTQFTAVNLVFEVGSRTGITGFKENFFRVGTSLNLSDKWFRKRKYD
jgi:hypothetical protein